MNVPQNKKNRLSLYWKCQISGWSLVSIYWAYVVFTRDHYGYFLTFLNYILDILIGIILTHGYRFIALKLKWNSLSLPQLFRKILPSIILLAVLYMLVVNIKWYFFWQFIGGKEIDLWNSLTYWDPVLLTGLRLMSIWILAYHLYHYYQNKIETTRQNAELFVIAKQAQLDNLSAQLNPHFLFNSLNSIKSLVIENPETARRAIDLLSDLLRSSLYEKDKDLITIKDELALVKDYIELEKLRFEERLQLEVTVDKSLETFKIPTLSIQLLVENAIKHGIDSKIEGGIVSITIKNEGGFVSIQVLNPGRLSLNKTSKGLGLKNLHERLKIQYNSKASFKLVALNNDIVEAKILIPFTANENI